MGKVLNIGLYACYNHVRAENQHLPSGGRPCRRRRDSEKEREK